MLFLVFIHLLDLLSFLALVEAMDLKDCKVTYTVLQSYGT